jgi:hypothetical protein
MTACLLPRRTRRGPLTPRAAQAGEVSAFGLRAGEAREGVLRRRAVGPRTRLVYERWIEALLKRSTPPPTDATLLGLSGPRYLALFHRSRRLAGGEPGVPHQSKHGAASADAMAGASDTTMMARGPWASPKSLKRYRTPARYLRRLHMLSGRQLALAVAAPDRITTAMEGCLRRGKKRR